MTAVPHGSPASADPGSWTDVVTAALIGTDRRPTGGTNPAADVLDRAAAWTPDLRAGIRAGTLEASVTSAPPESLPPASPAAEARLAVLLDGAGPLDSAARDAVLLEWLRLAVEHHRRIAPAQLPALLDFGRTRVDVRPLIVRVSGARGRWLADQNPEWQYLNRVAGDSGGPPVESATADPALWTMGARGQRVEYLRTLRRNDPAAGRELLEREWVSIPPDERADLLATLGIQIDHADEALLERALDDRRREVRDTAAALLQRLPDSAYATRAADRARRCVVVEETSIRVDPPVECDRAMRRDGIPPKPPSGIGERAWWLEEIVARAPLSTWGQPATFLAARLPDDWAGIVHRGLGRAAAAQRDPGWAARVLDLISETGHDRSIAAALYPVLPPEVLIGRAIAALRSGATAVWGPMLAACPAPWPEALSRAVFDGVTSLVNRTSLAGDLYQLTRLAAVRMAPALAPAARELADQAQAADPRARHGWLHTLATVLSFRLEMTQELL